MFGILVILLSNMFYKRLYYKITNAFHVIAKRSLLYANGLHAAFDRSLT